MPAGFSQSDVAVRLARQEERPLRDALTDQQFRRLGMAANNTRFPILSEPGVFPNLASFFLSRMTRRPGNDFRRAQGRKHAVACVLAARVLAELANMKGCLAAAQFARSLSQEELEAVGAW